MRVIREVPSLGLLMMRESLRACRNGKATFEERRNRRVQDVRGASDANFPFGIRNTLWRILFWFFSFRTARGKAEEEILPQVLLMLEVVGISGETNSS